jgi:hypothetical protein
VPRMRTTHMPRLGKRGFQGNGLWRWACVSVVVRFASVWLGYGAPQTAQPELHQVCFCLGKLPTLKAAG